MLVLKLVSGLQSKGQNLVCADALSEIIFIGGTWGEQSSAGMGPPGCLPPPAPGEERCMGPPALLTGTCRGSEHTNGCHGGMGLSHCSSGLLEGAFPYAPAPQKHPDQHTALVQTVSYIRSSPHPRPGPAQGAHTFDSSIPSLSPHFPPFPL